MTEFIQGDITVVRAFLVNPNDEFLLLRRTPAHKNNANLWELPGGRQEGDETLEETLRREMRQETSWECRIKEIDPNPIEDRIMRDPIRRGQRYLAYVAFAEVLHNDPIRLSTEHDSYTWQRRGEPLYLNVTLSTPAAIARFNR